MENKTSYDQAKIDQFKRLLEHAIPNGTIGAGVKFHDWIKYEVVCGANKSFLCVSFEFLGLDEAEISRLLERESVARAIQKVPKGSFMLTRDGLQQRSCEDV